MGHEIAAVWSVACRRMEPDPIVATNKKTNRGRKTREKLAIDDRVDSPFRQRANSSKRIESGCNQIVAPDGQDVFTRQERHHVKDETILLENQEIDVFAPDQLRRAANGGARQHCGTLLRQFDKQHGSHSWQRRMRAQIGQSAHNRQDKTEGNSDPTVGPTNGFYAHHTFWTSEDRIPFAVRNAIRPSKWRFAAYA